MEQEHIDVEEVTPAVVVDLDNDEGGTKVEVNQASSQMPHVQMDMQAEFHHTHGNDLLMDFESYESEGYEASSQKTQLELYLMEPKMKITDKLDVLDFWKSNQFRYPEISRMPADILSILVSTVASESAFSTGGRVLDQYRSALLPTNVEALVCTSNWLSNVKDVLAPTPEELTGDVMEEMMNGGLSH